MQQIEVKNLLPSTLGRYQFDISLARFCWFKVGGNAKVLYVPSDLQDLQHFLKNKPADLPILLLGAGSNILIRDGGFNGVVIRLGRAFNYVKSTQKENIIEAGCSTLSSSVSTYAMQNSLGGLEFLSSIPGTVGGAVYMNAGAYGTEIAQVLISAKALDIRGNLHNIPLEKMRYQYRSNGLAAHYIFIEASLQCVNSNFKQIEAKINEISTRRSRAQPIGEKTAGSAFKNPPNMQAWKLIEDAGCRALRIGGAEISSKHCNFFINTGNARAADIELLFETVQKRVFEHSGVLLDPEVKFYGDY